MFYPYLLNGIQRQFLNMETVDDALCAGESIAAYAVHAVGKIKRYLGYCIAQTAVNLTQGAYYRVRVCTEDNGHDCPLAAMGVLVGDYRIEFAIAQRGFVYAKMNAYVLREDKPLLGVPPLCGVFPLPIPAQMTLVLPLK